MAGTHYFARDITLNSLIHPAVLSHKLDGFNMSINVVVRIDRFKISRENLDASIAYVVS